MINSRTGEPINYFEEAAKGLAGIEKEIERSYLKDTLDNIDEILNAVNDFYWMDKNPSDFDKKIRKEFAECAENCLEECNIKIREINNLVRDMKSNI